MITDHGEGFYDGVKHPLSRTAAQVSCIIFPTRTALHAEREPGAPDAIVSDISGVAGKVKLSEESGASIFVVEGDKVVDVYVPSSTPMSPDAVQQDIQGD